MGDVCVSGDMWNEVRIFENIAHKPIHNLSARECFIQISEDRNTADSIINTDLFLIEKTRNSFSALLPDDFFFSFF